MSATEQRLSLLEQKAANSKPVNLLDLLISLVGDELLPIYSPSEQKLVKVSVQEFINATGIQNLSFNEIVHNQIITFDGTNFSYSPIVTIANVNVNAGQLVFLRLNILDETDGTLSKRLYLVEKPSGSYEFLTLLNSGDILELKREQADQNQANTVTYTATDLNEINTSNPALDFSDADLIYFVELDGVLYRFIGNLGLYGSGQLQMDMNDLSQIGSSQSNIVIDNGLSTSSVNAITNKAVATEFVRTNSKVLELINSNSDSSTTLAFNYGFVRSVSGTNTLELPTNNVSDFNLRGYVDANTLLIDDSTSNYTLIAPNGTTINADENFALISLKTNVMLLVKYNLGSGGGGGSGDMTKAVYDPQNILADAFARANHTGTQAVNTITGLGDLATLNQVDTDQIRDEAVTNAKLNAMLANTIKGREASNGMPQDLTPTQVRAIINVEENAQVNIAPIQYDTLVSPANEIDLASPSHVIYNQSNPTSAINFTLTNMQEGRTRQIEVQNNTNDAPETITINGSNTQNINKDLSIWDDTAVMIIYIHCYSATDFEWWFYPKLK